VTTNSKVIGIDLGTTNSVAAVIDATGRPEVVRNSEGSTVTPSVVLVQDDGAVLVGGMARRQAVARPHDVVLHVKRHMGDPDWRFVSASDQEYTAEQISAQILRKVADDTGRALAAEIRSAVITVPAYFDDSRRQATKDAAKIAGLEVLRIISEPTAAALAYGLDKRDAGICLVYDLGGGTFDVTVLQVSGGDFTVLATTGARNLGGFDFDNRLINWINEQVVDRGADDLLDDPISEARLRDQCEAAKHTLSQLDTVPVFVDSSGLNMQIELTREQFEALTIDLVQQTIEMVEEVVDAANLTMTDLDEVLLVGGSTRMPMITRAVDKATGRIPNVTLHPDEAVALGAAVQAEILRAEFAGEDSTIGVGRVNDVTAHGLGVIALDAVGRHEKNFVILPANTPIPRRDSMDFFTVADQQTQINVQVTIGDDEETEAVEIITKDAEGVPLEIPPYPKGSPIRVHIAYDIDGTVHVEVTDLVADKSLGEFPIDRRNNLSPDQVARMRHELSETKVR
jgi:molecular chaperone DnaK